jgi:transposase
MEKRQRSSFTLEQKVSFIEETMKPGATQVQVAKKFGLKQSTLNSILKKKEEILASASAIQKKKNLSKGTEHDLEEQLYDWFLKKHGQGLVMDRPLLRKQAEKLAQDMGLKTALTFSSGWLWRWRKRYNIKFKQQHGEQRSADFVAGQKWLEEKLPLLLAAYNASDIFNADETGFFYRGTKTRGLAPGNEKSAGGKIPKDRLTVLVTANMTGTEKRPLVVVGKAARPRGFPRDLTSLPVQYESSKRAWMTGPLWDKLLRQWDRSMRLQDRKILLIVDNAPSHPMVANLTHIRVEFLPPNTTSFAQPMDAGIIKNLKGKKCYMSLNIFNAKLCICPFCRFLPWRAFSKNLGQFGSWSWNNQ